MTKVKALFIGMDGVVHAENIPQTKREIEFMDGAHPINPDAIYYDIERKGPPLYVVWHGRPNPEGMPPDKNNESPFIKEAVHMVQHKRRTLLSKRYYRLFVRSVVMFFKVAVIGFLISFAGLLLMVVVI